MNQQDVVTNGRGQTASSTEPYGLGHGGYLREWAPGDPAAHVRRGDELARFELGSTVVLVFEAPQDFGFAVAVGDKVRQGQSLGARGRGLTAEPTPFTSLDTAKST